MATQQEKYSTIVEVRGSYWILFFPSFIATTVQSLWFFPSQPFFMTPITSECIVPSSFCDKTWSHKCLQLLRDTDPSFSGCLHGAVKISCFFILCSSYLIYIMRSNVFYIHYFHLQGACLKL